MHLRAINGGIKAQEMGAQSAVKTAAKDERGSGFGEALRAMMSGAASAPSTVSAPFAKAKGNTPAGKQQGKAEEKMSAAEPETKADGAGSGERRQIVSAPKEVVVSQEAVSGPEASKVQEVGPGRAAAAVVEIVKSTAADPVIAVKTVDTKMVKCVKKMVDCGETKSVVVPGQVAVQGAVSELTVAPAGLVAAAIQVPLVPQVAVPEKADSGTLSVAATPAKPVAAKGRKTGPEAKDQAGAERPVAVSGQTVVQSGVEGKAVVAGKGEAVSLPVGRVEMMKDGAAELVAPAAVGVMAAQGGQGLGHAVKAVASVAVAAPRVVGGGDEVKTLAATPNVLEVGLSDGTHGWLKVRAQVGQGGEIAASLVTASAGQADALRRELPAISTYLAGESVEVSTVVVHAAGQAAGLGASAQDAGASAGGLTQGGQASDGGSAAREERGGKGAGAGLMEQDAAQEMWFNEVAPAAVLGGSYGSGRWLSVVA